MTDASYSYSSFTDDSGDAAVSRPKITGQKHQVRSGNEPSVSGRNGVGSHEKKQRTSSSTPSLLKQSHNGSRNYSSSTPGRSAFAPLSGNTPLRSASSKFSLQQGGNDNNNNNNDLCTTKTKLCFDTDEKSASTSASTTTAAAAAQPGGEVAAEPENPPFSITDVGNTRNGKGVVSAMQMLRSKSRRKPSSKQVFLTPVQGIEGTDWFPHDEQRKKLSMCAKGMVSWVARGKKHEMEFKGDDSFERRHNRTQEELAALNPPIFLSDLGQCDQMFSLVCAAVTDPRIATDALSAISTGCFLHCATCDSLVNGLSIGASGKFSCDVGERVEENFVGSIDTRNFTRHVQHCHLYNRVCPCGESLKGLVSKGWGGLRAMNHMHNCTGATSPDLMLIEMKLFYEEFGAGVEPVRERSTNRSSSWTVSREANLWRRLSDARYGRIECDDEQKKELARLGQDLQPRLGGSAPVGLEFRRGTVPIFADATNKSGAVFGKDGLNLKGGNGPTFREVKNKNVPLFGLTLHSAEEYETFPGWIKTAEAVRAKAEWQSSDDFRNAKKKKNAKKKN